MKKCTIFLSMLCSMIAFWATAQQPFTAGNIVVLRVGDGSIPLSSGTRPVFLDEFTPSGVLVRSLPMPTEVNGVNQRFTLNGFYDVPTSASGMLNLSPDGKWLSAAGYALPSLSLESEENSTTERVVGLIDNAGNINTSTKLSDAGLGIPYAAVTTNGTDIWACFSNDGLRYTTLGNSTSVSLVTNLFPDYYQFVGINNGQLYATSYLGRVRTIGSGLPVTGGQTATSIPGGPSGGQGQVQFFFADINPAIPGNDVLYVAHAFFGLQKFSFNGSSWVINGTIGEDADDYRGITGTVNGTTVTLYCTRKGATQSQDDPTGGPSGGGELVTLTDASGYNGTLTGTPTLLATAPFQTAFRGVAFAPHPSSVKVSAKAFLQGAYNTSLGRHKEVTTAWANVLNTNALTQPFNVAPFNYAGTEHVSAGFFTSTAGVNTDITDWVLLELRDATTPATIISRQAALIREDGQIVDVDGVSPVPMTALTGVADGNYYIVIKHRNHLAIRSANPVALNGTTATLYDFTDNQNKAFQNGSITGNAAMATKDLPGTETGKFLLWGGNANGDGFIRASGASNVSDYLTLLGPLCLQGDFSKIINNVYRKEDMNLDGVVRASAALNVNDYITLLSTGILGGNTSNIITAH